MTPLLGVVIPAFNPKREHLLRAVHSALAQEEATIVVVVDDGSTSIDIERELWALAPRCMSVIHQANQGQAVAIRTGIESMARMDLVALLDVDDEWKPGKLRAQLELLARDPRLGGAVCHMDERVEGSPVGVRAPLLDQPARLFSALVAKRVVFRPSLVGYPDPALGMGATLDWFARADHLGVRIGCVPKALYYRSIHGENYSYVHRAEERDYHVAVKRALERKRAAPR